MSNIGYGRGMLDYVQKTCASVKSVDYASVPSDGSKSVQALFPDARDIDGEFHPDPEQVAAWEDATGVRPEYGEELRYVNCGPTKIRNLLATETDPREREALERAYKAWQGISPMEFDPDNMGWVHRGEPREAINTTMQEMHANLDPVRWEMESMGSLSAKGSGPRIPAESGEESLSLGDELEMALDSNMSADDLYLEAGGWVPPCGDSNDIDLFLEYDVDEVISY